MKLRTLVQVMHPSVLGSLIKHPPQLIDCEICGGTRVQIRTAVHPDTGSRCISCRGTGQHRGAFRVIRKLFGDDLTALRGKHVYEISAHGALFKAFTRLAPSVGFTLTSSELMDCPLGQSINGVRCEDLERLTFANEQFDLITSSALMEHVENDAAAFSEVARVLKPGGHYVFTVPFEDRPTILRAVREADGTVRHLQPPEYHSDPWNPGGVFTWRSYGPDIVQTITSAGLVGEAVKVSVAGIRAPLTVVVASRPH